MRALAAAIALFLITTPAPAASPQVEAAVKVLQTIAADAGKLKIFCEMSFLDEKMGDRDDPTIQAQIDKLANQLGADFIIAWAAINALDETSPDGKVLSAALDQLEDKCPN
jgi:hypothetical protein